MAEVDCPEVRKARESTLPTVPPEPTDIDSSLVGWLGPRCRCCFLPPTNEVKARAVWGIHPNGNNRVLRCSLPRAPFSPLARSSGWFLNSRRRLSLSSPVWPCVPKIGGWLVGQTATRVCPSSSWTRTGIAVHAVPYSTGQDLLQASDRKSLCPPTILVLLRAHGPTGSGILAGSRSLRTIRDDRHTSSTSRPNLHGTASHEHNTSHFSLALSCSSCVTS